MNAAQKNAAAHTATKAKPGGRADAPPTQLWQPQLAHFVQKLGGRAPSDEQQHYMCESEEEDSKGGWMFLCEAG